MQQPSEGQPKASEILNLKIDALSTEVKNKLNDFAKLLNDITKIANDALALANNAISIANATASTADIATIAKLVASTTAKPIANAASKPIANAATKPIANIATIANTTAQCNVASTSVAKKSPPVKKDTKVDKPTPVKKDTKVDKPPLIKYILNIIESNFQHILNMLSEQHKKIIVEEKEKLDTNSFNKWFISDFLVKNGYFEMLNKEYKVEYNVK